jgi:SNF2 family DNA or RNA helicase
LDLAKTLKERAVLLPSGLEMGKRQQIIESFLKGPYKCLVANPASAGHGITLNESSNVIYYSNSFNYEYRAQSEDRNHRIGQTQSVLYTDLIAPDTIESKTLEILLSKREMSELVLTSTYVKELLS